MRDGLRFLIERGLDRSAKIRRSWAPETPRVFRYEELLDDEVGTFRRMFRAAGLAVRDDRLERAVRAHSFAARSGRRPGEEGVRSHFRKGVAGDWRRYLDGDLKDLFKLKYADLLIATGYEQDGDW